MSLREKRLEFRTKHRKRCLRDRRLERFINKADQTVENNNGVPLRKKPFIVTIYER